MSFLKSLKVDAVKEALAASIKATQENISSFDVGEAVQGAKKAATDGMGAIGKAVESITHKAPEETEGGSSLKNLISLLWCMAFADGTISEAERKTLEELSMGIDENYEDYREEFESGFTTNLMENRKEFGHAAAVKLEAKSNIEALGLTPVDAKLLCWNLLALANIDGLDESELDLIRYISEQAGLETSILEELRNYSDAIVETANAREQLEQSNRAYSEIEPIVNELEKREQTLIEAAQSLIADM